MMPQQESSAFPFSSDVDAPYYFNLKRVQESALHVYRDFPLQSNKDFFVSS